MGLTIANSGGKEKSNWIRIWTTPHFGSCGRSFPVGSVLRFLWVKSRALMEKKAKLCNFHFPLNAQVNGILSTSDKKYSINEPFWIFFDKNKWRGLLFGVVWGKYCLVLIGSLLEVHFLKWLYSLYSWRSPLWRGIWCCSTLVKLLWTLWWEVNKCPVVAIPIEQDTSVPWVGGGGHFFYFGVVSSIKWICISSNEGKVCSRLFVGNGIQMKDCVVTSCNFWNSFFVAKHLISVP